MYSFTAKSQVRQQSSYYLKNGSLLTMRKQKASDKRTRRMQKDLEILSLTDNAPLRSATSALSPILSAGVWQHKSVSSVRNDQFQNAAGKGRGRSRKRSAVYNNLGSYHNHFLALLTEEFTAEVSI
jgi:hypothetical protein